jgi:hypothetical protein
MVGDRSNPAISWPPVREMKSRGPPLRLLGKRAFGTYDSYRRARHRLFECAPVLAVSPAAGRQLHFGPIRRRRDNRYYPNCGEQHVCKQVAHFSQLYSR